MMMDLQIIIIMIMILSKKQKKNKMYQKMKLFNNMDSKCIIIIVKDCKILRKIKMI